MKILSITDAKRQLPELLQSTEPVEVTRRGESLGVLSARRVSRPRSTPRAAAEAVRRAHALAARTPTVTDPARGITAELRQLRERGEST